MPFVLRVTSTPPLAQITAIPQLVIIDQTGPAVRVGASPFAVALVGEFLKGPFVPTEVTSGGQVQSLFGGVSALLSQTAAGVQDGSGVLFNGNGALALKRKTFQRLVLQRVDTDLTTTDAGTTKAYVKFTVKVDSADRDASFNTIRDIIIPAGTRFGDDTLALSTGIVALSQDVTIPKGTATTLDTDRVIIVDPTKLVQTGGSAFTYNPTSLLPKTGATAFFVKGTTLGSGTLDTAIDTALPNVTSTLRNTAGDNAGVTLANAATAIFAAGTAAVALAIKIASLYAAAINKLLPNDSPQNQIKAVWSARRTSTIRTTLVQHAIDASSAATVARVAVVSADPSADSSASAAATALTAAIGLGAAESIQQDRAVICFPQSQLFSDELGYNVTLNSDSWMAEILSNFPSEKNPGANPAPLLNGIVAMEPAFALNPLSKQDYINLQAGGVCPLQKDPTVGWWFTNGVTAVNPTLQPTRVPIKRRMMADEIQAGLAQIAAPYLKEPATTERVDSFVGEIDAYLGTLLSPDNPALQRIQAFSVDAKSGNTDELTSIGIFTILIAVRLLASMDDIILSTQIGETVDVPAEAA